MNQVIPIASDRRRSKTVITGTKTQKYIVQASRSNDIVLQFVQNLSNKEF